MAAGRRWRRLRWRLATAGAPPSPVAAGDGGRRPHRTRAGCRRRGSRCRGASGGRHGNGRPVSRHSAPLSPPRAGQPPLLRPRRRGGWLAGRHEQLAQLTFADRRPHRRCRLDAKLSSHLPLRRCVRCPRSLPAATTAAALFLLAAPSGPPAETRLLARLLGAALVDRPVVMSGAAAASCLWSAAARVTG